VFSIEKLKRVIITVKPPSGHNLTEPPSAQNWNAGGSGNGCAGVNGGTSSSSSQLPVLDILWSPAKSHPRTSTNLDLSPSKIFEDVLENLRVTLYSQTQYCATYPSQDGIASSTVEPTLVLYCPIESGDVLLTRLARRVGQG
jgi:hypothetical protein